jgi:DNA replication factor GINS
MYNELYEIWKHELEKVELGRLSRDFYARIADYLRRLKEEGRMLDKRTVKATLLKNEMQNAKRMVRELIRTRRGKIVMKVARGEKIPSDLLTATEEKIYTGVSPFAEAHQSFAKSILQGHVPRIDAKQKRKSAVLRFLKDVPAIIGADMEAYGPFRVEDIASLHVENAKILIKQGLAEKIEVN